MRRRHASTRQRQRSLAVAVAVCAMLGTVLVTTTAAQPATSDCPPAPSSPAGASVPMASAGAPSPSEQLVACVGLYPITETTFEHWARVARDAVEPPSKHDRPPRTVVVNEVMGFLVSSDWVLAEAQALGIVVTEATVRRTFDRIRDQQFPRRREFRRFLRQSGQTVADLLLRVKLNLLSARIQKRVVAGHRGARSRERALSRFVREFKARWTAQTYCAPAYAVADCGHVQAL